ncbi:alpha-amylase [Alsobacter metallidurans]|uniref:Alpha-amylase n=1 Tax=Alsobacter metallidurans TaxID=340221 RepID=A0A917I4G1_9HYPH|nr:alpha-amylase family glycosyl hydrolase [Alsobacter metallidurans]GGH09373.1 alpha-amylase [Alsobacter metallidurans]
MAERTWWKRGIVYQIYPRSFQDSNRDGVGDLEGIRQRLDHLTWLGVDALWISPIYPSPMCDGGYDVADYRDIDPLFGSLDSFDALIADAHARDLKVILDFVPNHSSDRHAWFAESRSSRDNPKRDWYIWRDPAPGGGPPNNWISNFGGSAWQFDEATGQYYYHAFLKEQPDLNWRNPQLREAMFDTLRFWLDRGVDGFRVDVIWHLMKDPEMRDNPPNPGYAPGQPDINRLLQIHSADHPDIYGVLAGMRQVLDAYPDRVLIGEIYLPIERLVTYYGPDLSGAHLPFNFQLIHATWRARDIEALVREYEEKLPEGGWPNWVLSNHDQPRIATRVGQAQARIAAMMLLTLRGTPTLYYGDELGMPAVHIPRDRVQDPWEKNEPGLGIGRDPSRTPMPWDRSFNAGFSEVEPWLPLNQDWHTRNVAVMKEDPTSTLTLTRRLIALRNERKSLTVGRYAPVLVDDHVFVYRREAGDEQALVALNFSGEDQTVTLPQGAQLGAVLLSTLGGREGERTGAKLHLRGHEGLVIEAHREPH